MATKTFYEREFKKPKRKNYSEQEIIFYVEILTLNRRSAIPTINKILLKLINMTGQDLIDLADHHIGEPYILGSLAPKNDANYKGPWDCAEFVSAIVFQITGKLYGCANDQSTHPETADAGTIYWAEDLNRRYVQSISIDEARATPGAILLREAGGGLDGHIVFSRGDGSTTEAHGHADGVVNNVVDGRRWTAGIYIPGVTYAINGGNLKPVAAVEVLHLNGNNDVDDVKEVQQALEDLGYAITVDGSYGPNTYAAVRDFQNKKGLTPDGEVGPHTEQALGLNF